MMMMQSFLQPQSSAMSQRRQRLWGSLRQGMEVEGQREEEKKDEDLECELQLSPNGCRQSLGEWSRVAGSGSKLKVHTKILNRNKKMELLNAKRLVSEAKAHKTSSSFMLYIVPLGSKGQFRLIDEFQSTVVVFNNHLQE